MPLPQPDPKGFNNETRSDFHHDDLVREQEQELKRLEEELKKKQEELNEKKKEN